MISNKTVVSTSSVQGERPAIYGPKGQAYMYFKDRTGRNYLQEVSPMNFSRVVESVSAFMLRRKTVV